MNKKAILLGILTSIFTITWYIHNENKEDTNVINESYIELSDLTFDIKDELAKYEDINTGLEIDVYFFDDKTEAIDITMPTHSLYNIEFKKQLEISMKRIGGSHEDIEILNNKIKECLTKSYQSLPEVKDYIKKWDGMYRLEVINNNDYNVSIVVNNAGEEEETICIEFIMF